MLLMEVCDWDDIMKGRDGNDLTAVDLQWDEICKWVPGVRLGIWVYVRVLR